MEKALLMAHILLSYSVLHDILIGADGGRASNLQGRPMPSLSASQGIGSRGETLTRDFLLMEKLAAFNRERIPERVVHASGAGAYGDFQVSHDLSQYTKASFLNGVGKRTRVTVRFSTAVGDTGTPDTAIDHNGFAVKFHTETGNHDLVGNNLEPFPVRDPILFPDVNRSRKRHPQTHKPCPNMFWDFISLRPETTLHTLHLFSDRGRPDGFTQVDGFGVHAFKLVNEAGQVVYAKFHWRSNQKREALSHTRAAELAGSNPGYKADELFEAIASAGAGKGAFPSWDLFVQVMSEESAATYPVNPFDVTKVWREENVPLLPVGKMTLNRNPDNYFAEVEQVAFAPSNMVAGIEPSPDRMLAARLFAYQDAQRYRLGVNFPQLRVNKPVVEVHSYARDGQACHGDNALAAVNYFPNSFGGFTPDPVGASNANLTVEGTVHRYDFPEDDTAHARLFLERDVDAEQRERLVAAIADELRKTRSEIQERVLANIFFPISAEFADEIRAVLAAHTHF